MPSAKQTSKLIFHIGHHKTGTTSIQDALATGRILVEGQRILYTAGMAHNYLRRHFDAFVETGTARKGRAAMPGLTEIEERLSQGNFDFAVFSAEEFEDSNPSEVSQVLNTFMLPHVDDHMVLCYVRPHAARTLSSYAERVKIGSFDGGLDDFHASMLQSGRLRYASRLAPWVETFGPRLVVRPMVRSVLHRQSVVDDFARVAFGSEANVTVNASRLSNETLFVEDIAMLRHVMSHLKRHDRLERHPLGWVISAALNSGIRSKPGTKPVLHRALAEDIRRIYLSDARAMDQQFFATEPVMVQDLERAVDTAVAEPQSFEPSDHFAPDELRNLSALAQVIDAMLDNENGGWAAFLHKRRVSALHSDIPSRPKKTRPGARRP